MEEPAGSDGDDDHDSHHYDRDHEVNLRGFFVDSIDSDISSSSSSGSNSSGSRGSRGSGSTNKRHQHQYA